MNIYIMADLEGISGIYARDQVTPDGKRFAEARKYLTREINLCAKFCREVGAEKIYVRDAHGGSYTILWDELSPDIDLAVCGITGDVRYPFIEDCDGVILLGYHAMAGTRGGLLEHTMSSASVQHYILNGITVGEIALDAHILADYNKPVILVTGDTAACAEARRMLPGVCTAEVKKSIACYGTALLSPARSEEVLCKGVYDAMHLLKSGAAKTYPTSHPVTLEVEYTERTQLPNPAAKPYMTVIDGRTIRVTAENVEEALFRL